MLKAKKKSFLINIYLCSFSDAEYTLNIPGWGSNFEFLLKLVSTPSVRHFFRISNLFSEYINITSFYFTYKKGRTVVIKTLFILQLLSERQLKIKCCEVGLWFKVASEKEVRNSLLLFPQKFRTLVTMHFYFFLDSTTLFHLGPNCFLLNHLSNIMVDFSWFLRC